MLVGVRWGEIYGNMEPGRPDSDDPSDAENIDPTAARTVFRIESRTRIYWATSLQLESLDKSSNDAFRLEIFPKQHFTIFTNNDKSFAGIVCVRIIVHSIV